MYVYSHWSLEADEPEKEATNFSFNSILLIVWKVRKIPGKEKKRKEKKKRVGVGTEEKHRQEIAHPNPNLNLCFVSHSYRRTTTTTYCSSAAV